jgi:hypothetical protein
MRWRDLARSERPDAEDFLRDLDSATPTASLLPPHGEDLIAGVDQLAKLEAMVIPCAHPATDRTANALVAARQLTTARTGDVRRTEPFDVLVEWL